jgi:hypothetical protein
MNRTEFLEKMVGRKRITQEQADAIKNKEKALDDAIELYTKNKSKMTKAEITAVLDTIVANKAVAKAKASTS